MTASHLLELLRISCTIKHYNINLSTGHAALSWVNKDMDITRTIQSAFPKVSYASEISDSFITRNQNLMELDEISDYFKVVPAYMLWCIKYKDSELVDGYTINSLAEYGKTKSKDNTYLNFMHLCNNEQKLAVIRFLEWCTNEISTIDTTQAQRAIKNWSN